MTTELGPPIDVLYPKRRTVPLVISSPHSGWIYPPDLLDAVALGPAQLRRLEDGCVDRLFACAAGLGAPVLRARFARAYVDPNREPYELDPALFDGVLPAHVNVGSSKARAGLGTIPSRLGGRAIYRGGLDYAEAERRLRLAYWPYHETLQRLLAEALAKFGRALLLDCHSMPRLSTNGADDGGAVTKAHDHSIPDPDLRAVAAAGGLDAESLDAAKMRAIAAFSNTGLTRSGSLAAARRR